MLKLPPTPLGLLKRFVLLSLSIVLFEATANTAFAKKPAPSSTAQSLYQYAKNDLLQLRILTKTGKSQATVGSGFFIGKTNLVVTNYHVVSQLALKPKKYIGEYLDTDGKSGTLELIAVDVLNDLAVVRVNRNGTGFFSVPEKSSSLKQGEYLYSLGNPLDLGFTISEGTFNGIIRRSFYDEYMFTGPINPGMSGGPCITSDGKLAGVNVSHRTDGELVSFIVPAKYVRALFEKAVAMKAPEKDFKETVGQQLISHQTVMIDKVLDKPLSFKKLGHYRVPVRESDQLRCWGETSDNPKQLYTVAQIQCSMESNVIVSDELRTGDLSIRHQFRQSTKLDPFRFSQLVAKAVGEEHFGDHKDKNLTSPACTEQFLNNGTLSMRAVLCVRAYKKFAGVYDFAVLTDTGDEPTMNLKSRLDVRGVSYDNGLRISRIFIEGIGREKTP